MKTQKVVATGTGVGTGKKIVLIYNQFGIHQPQYFKSKDEPFEVWFNRKVSEQVNGGTDEQVMSRKGDGQSPNPSF